jgi:hypothetical protein
VTLPDEQLYGQQQQQQQNEVPHLYRKVEAKTTTTTQLPAPHGQKMVSPPVATAPPQLYRRDNEVEKTVNRSITKPESSPPYAPMDADLEDDGWDDDDLNFEDEDKDELVAEQTAPAAISSPRVVEPVEKPHAKSNVEFTTATTPSRMQVLFHEQQQYPPHPAPLTNYNPEDDIIETRKRWIHPRDAARWQLGITK